MNFKNTSLILVIFLFFSINTNAFEQGNWITYHTDNDIKIEYQYINCEYPEQFNQEFVVLKITNFTNKDLTVSWQNESWYDKKCLNCSDDFSAELLKKVDLKANEVLVGNCNEPNNLRIFSKFSDKIENMPGIKKIVKLTKFKLKNINTSYE